MKSDLITTDSRQLRRIVENPVEAWAEQEARKERSRIMVVLRSIIIFAAFAFPAMGADLKYAQTPPPAPAAAPPPSSAYNPPPPPQSTPPVSIEKVWAKVLVCDNFVDPCLYNNARQTEEWVPAYLCGAKIPGGYPGRGWPGIAPSMMAFIVCVRPDGTPPWQVGSYW